MLCRPHNTKVVSAYSPRSSTQCTPVVLQHTAVTACQTTAQAGGRTYQYTAPNKDPNRFALKLQRVFIDRNHLSVSQYGNNNTVATIQPCSTLLCQVLHAAMEDALPRPRKGIRDGGTGW